MKYVFLLLSFGLLLSNCGSRKDAVEKELRGTVILSPDSLYNYSAVDNAVKKLTAVNRKVGTRFFLIGLNTYRNKKDPAGSLDMLKQALTFYPNARGFYELGNALAEAKVFDESDNAYGVALRLDYKPAFKVYYNEACNASMRNDSTGAIDYLREALEGGYKNKEKILKDKDLNNIRGTETFKILVAKYLSGANIGKKAYFSLLLTGFPKVSLPYILEKPFVAVNDKSLINYDFADFIPGMVDSRYSRDVTDEYVYTAALVNNDSVKVFAYTALDAITDTLSHVTTSLISYDTSGKVIDNLVFAGRMSPDKIKTGTFDQNHHITIKTYTNTWKEDPDDKGYKGNSIIKTELTETRYYVLDKTGHFKQTQNAEADAEGWK